MRGASERRTQGGEGREGACAGKIAGATHRSCVLYSLTAVDSAPFKHSMLRRSHAPLAVAFICRADTACGGGGGGSWKWGREGLIAVGRGREKGAPGTRGLP